MTFYSMGNRGLYILLAKVTAPDIIEIAVVALTDDRIYGSRSDTNIRIVLKHISHQRISDLPDAQRINRGLVINRRP